MSVAEFSDMEAYERLEQTVEGFPKTEKLFAVRRLISTVAASRECRNHFPARISGADAEDLPFNFDCVIDNISSTGLYLRMPLQTSNGGQVRIIVQLLRGPAGGASATIYGEILRDEPQPDGKHGVAVAIKGHKFL